MRKSMAALAAVFVFTACDGNPFIPAAESADTSAGTVTLTEEGTFLTLNNISYNPDTDTLTLNNIPFDDPNNDFTRITTEAFTNGYDAYESAPAAGTNEIQYYAIFRRSDSGLTQVASAGTTRYVDFGYGGSVAQRLGDTPTLPASGIFSYNGEYGAVRVTNGGGGTSNTLNYVTGTATLRVDFDDFDNTGAIGGTIDNRQLYDTTGAPVGALAGFISLQDTSMDFTNATIATATASEFVTGTGATGVNGQWEGVFAGPNGEEIAGILFIEGGNIRESGSFVATR